MGRIIDLTTEDIGELISSISVTGWMYFAIGIMGLLLFYVFVFME